MADNFGVQLKKPHGVQGESKGLSSQRPYGIRRDFQSKPMSDIKAMFEKGSDGSSKVPTEFGTNFAKKATTTQNEISSSTTSSKFSAIKTKTNITPSNQKRETFQKSEQLSANDLAAFDMLKHAIEIKGVDHLDDDLTPTVAVAKVYDGGQPLKATVEKKSVKKSNSLGSGNEVSKSEAISMLSFGLTKLRTRPGSFGNEDKSSQPSVKENIDSSIKQGAKTETVGSGMKEKVTTTSAIKHNVVGDSKYVPGIPRGWKSNLEEKNGRSSPNLDENKVGNDVTDTKNEHRVLVRAISPVTRKNSSSDSSTGNLSPRGYKSPYMQEQNRSDSPISAFKVDVSRPSRKAENSDKLVTAKANEKSKFTISKNDKNEDLEIIKSKLKPTSSIHSDSKHSSARSDGTHVANKDISWNNKTKVNLEGVSKERSRINSSSSTESSSSLSKSDTVGIKSKIDRFGSPELQTVSHSSEDSKAENRHLRVKPNNETLDAKSDKVEYKKKEFAVSRRISAEKFQDLRKGFETSKENQVQTVELRKKIGIIPAKKILERRESFENPESFNQKEIKKEIASPISRKKLLERKASFEHPERYRKSSGSSEIITSAEKGRVIQTIRSLNELEEAAKSRPSLKRRSRSLPSSDRDDDVDSSGYYEDVEHEHGPYYHDIHGVRYGDDISNEGDISSEADLLYEEIPALKGGRGNKNSFLSSFFFYIVVIFIIS